MGNANTPGHERAADSNTGRTIELDVLDQAGKRGSSRAPRMGRTRNGRIRAVVLIVVNLLMIAHLVQWAIAGSTISPVEPSESMETIEVGVVNAGAIMFAIALLTTAIFGRFFCGWLCHMVSLQDLCAYIMVSIGIRPKPFRARLLMFVPLMLGFYMFLWPTSKKIILAPALKAMEIDWPAWIKPVHPIQRWENGLVVEDFWSSFPDWYIAVPFLLICGFGTVYFLGAKGLCTYACPYGGFFAPLDKLAPVRIKVNDNCHQCGHCTSVCTSNVRVSEEVRDFGMVIDQGCMKTLDCVSACPNDALSIGIARPALGAKPRSPDTAAAAKIKRKRRYDLGWGEEIAAMLLFLWLFFAIRGMLDQVPMLFAGGVAVCGTMMAWLGWSIATKPNARLYSINLKSKGSITLAGYAYGLVLLACLAISAWSGQARFARWRGDVLYAGSKIPAGYLMRPEYHPSAELKRDAESAVGWFARADSFANGGLGWDLNAEHRLRQSYFLLILNRPSEASETLIKVIERGNPSDNLVYQAAQLMRLAGEPQEAQLAMMERALTLHPNLHKIRSDLAMRDARANGFESAEAFWTAEDAPVEEPGFLLERMRYYGNSGDQEKMLEFYDAAVQSAREDRNTAGWLVDIAAMVGRFRFQSKMLELLNEAVELPSANPSTLLSAAELFRGIDDRARALEVVEKAITMRGGDAPMIRARAAGVIASPDTIERSRKMLLEAEQSADDPFTKVQIGRAMMSGGMNLNSMDMIKDGLASVGRVVEKYPQFPILRHDYASFLQAAGERERGAEEMSKAAEMDPSNEVFASRASQMWSSLGNTERAEHWQQESDRRSNMQSP